MSPATELREAYEDVQDGEDRQGKIDHGRAVIEYETLTPKPGSRYFKIRVTLPDQRVGASPPPSVRDAVVTAMRVVPDADFLPEDGDMAASVKA